MFKTCVEIQKKLKKTALVMIIAFPGLAFQSVGMEEEKYPIWKGEVREDAKYMKEVAPEFESLSPHWRVKLLPEMGENIYEIIGFPGQQRSNKTPRGYEDYRPAFTKDYKFDSLIFTRSEKCDFMDNFWTSNGYSSHLILSKEGLAFIHANPLNDEKGQMAGKWNARSLEVAFIDEGDHNLSLSQQTALKHLIAIFEERSSNIKLIYGGSIWDTKQLDNISGFESGKVNNLSEVLNFLNLSQLTL